MLSRKYLSQLEFCFLHLHAETVEKQITPLRERLEEEGVQHGTITVDLVRKEDITEVFAIP